jgi:tripartite-type tricarboxylate transporter receptor subunit TctC
MFISEKKNVWIVLSILVLVFGILLVGCSGEPTSSDQTSTEYSSEASQSSENGKANEQASEKEDVAAFYKGNTINWIVPYKPGGGYDEYSRLLAPYIEKYTGATVVVNNVEGAGGMRGANEIYRAPNDGLTFGIVNGSALITNVLADIEGVVYELDKYSWIGRVVADPRALVVSTDSPYQSYEDLKNSGEPIILGATGLGGSTYVDAVITSEALGLPVEVVHGFDSSSVVQQALIRGDITGMWGSWGSRKDQVESGIARVILQSGDERLKDLPDIPTWLEVVETERGKNILEVLESLTSLGRPVAAPPGVPEEKMQFLREAFRKVMEDPDFLAAAEKAGRGLNYAPGDKIAEMAIKATKMPDDIKAIFVKAIKGDL